MPAAGEKDAIVLLDIAAPGKLKVEADCKLQDAVAARAEYGLSMINPSGMATGDLTSTTHGCEPFHTCGQSLAAILRAY